MFGTRSIKHYAVLALLCLAAFAATQAHAGVKQSAASPTVVTSAKGNLLINGVPRLLIMAPADWCPDTTTVDNNVSIGVKVMEGAVDSCSGENGPIAALHAVLSNKVLWREDNPSAITDPASLPELLDWRTELNLNNDSFLLGCSSQSAAQLYDNVRRTAKPVMYQIVLRDELGPGQKNCLTPNKLSILFWTPILAGARVVEYSTTLPWNGRKGFSVNPSLLPQAKKLAGQLGLLEPVILKGRNVVVKGAGTSIKVGAWKYGQATYIIAVNPTDKPAKVKLAISSLKSLSAQVLWEGKSVKVQKGVISQTFASLSVHIYKSR